MDKETREILKQESKCQKCRWHVPEDFICEKGYGSQCPFQPRTNRQWLNSLNNRELTRFIFTEFMRNCENEGLKWLEEEHDERYKIKYEDI